MFPWHLGFLALFSVVFFVIFGFISQELLELQFGVLEQLIATALRNISVEQSWFKNIQQHPLNEWQMVVSSIFSYFPLQLKNRAINQKPLRISYFGVQKT